MPLLTSRELLKIASGSFRQFPVNSDRSPARPSQTYTHIFMIAETFWIDLLSTGY